MNYELESKLRDKAEKWELHSLEEKIRNLNNDIFELRKVIGQNETRMSNQVYVIQRLITIIMESEVLKDNTHLLYDIQNIAY